MKKWIAKLLKIKEQFNRIEAQQSVILKQNKDLIDEIKMNQGMILTKLNQNLTSKNIQDYEFKVFSQWGEDGIIQFLINAIEIKNKTFIEFGVENFMESNCRFLLMKDNWQGMVIDGSEENIKQLKSSNFYWKYQLDAITAFITKENINELLLKSGFEKDLGLLSVDIDGNDYHVLNAIDEYQPRILICEYNAVFGSERKITVPYCEDFYRTNAHYSNLYFGASLKAIIDLAKQKSYVCVGTNSSGGNAFFVRKDLMNDKLQEIHMDEIHAISKFRESRDENGDLTYLGQEDRVKIIQGLSVVNTESGALEIF
jgi:hypothetical protein